ncbi:MAG: site-specific integrase, partial [Deltaproteobacteria bacterium]|nr:site-specific integrase [Deltaproteobacteria bacterium]
MACISKRRGRWVIDFYDQHGVRRWKTMPEDATKGQAKEELRSIEEMVEEGVYLSSGKTPTFSDVARDWLAHKKLKLRETTWEVYAGHVRNHFSDLDHLKINRIKIATVEKFIDDRQAQGMNLGTLRKILVTLGQILSYAVRHKYLRFNPLKEAERPRSQGELNEDDDCCQDMKILTPAQITIFLAQVNDPKYRTLFMLAIFSGARQGELLGLRWGDVDWGCCQLAIQRTFNNGRLFTPKSKTSKRKIDLGPKVIKELKKWRLACPKNDLNLIFPNEAGNHMNNKNMLRRFFRPALKTGGCPAIRFHDLRHTYASLLIEQGENIKYIQTQLGHSSPTVTLNVYAHLMKPINQEAAC